MAGTRWVRLDVEYFGNPKTSGLSPVAQTLHLASIFWAGAHLTDGHIPTHIVSHLRSQTGARRSHVDALVTSHLWVPVSSGYLIHDYLAMQDSRLKVESRRKKKAERMAAWRADHGYDGEDV